MSFIDIKTRIIRMVSNSLSLTLIFSSLITNEIHRPILAKENEYISENKINDNYLNLRKDTTPYILGKGDRLSVRISREKLFPKKFVTIDSNGSIFLDKIGSIYVEGLTIDELKPLLNKRYKEYVLEPEVELEIVSHRPISVYIKGEVNTPGLFVLNGEIPINSAGSNLVINDTENNSNFQTTYFPRLFNVIQEAGGVNIYSDLSNIEIIRKNTLSNGGGLIKTSVNFLELLLEGNNTYNPRILDQDIITIKKSKKEIGKQLSAAIQTNLNPKFIKVSISGRVMNPGTKNLNKLSTLNDAVELSGGPKVLKGKVFFIRYKSNGEIDKRLFKYNKNSKAGSYSNPYLLAGDLINIRKGNFKSTSELLGEILEPLTTAAGGIGIYKLLTD